VAVAVEQPNAPLRIAEFEAESQSARSGSQFTSARLAGIQYGVEIENISGRKIDAYRLGFVAFNVFNEFLSQFGGYSLDEFDLEDSEGASWYHTISNAQTFHTGVVCVDRVRFENGDVWVADLELIGARLMQIEEDFDLSILSEDEERTP